MPAVNLSPLFNDAQLDSNGNPYSLFPARAGMNRGLLIRLAPCSTCSPHARG